MDFFRNVNTRSKLIMCFAVLMVVILIPGAMNLYQLMSMKESIQMIYKDRLIPLVDLGEISYELSNLRIGALQIVGEPDESKRRAIFERAKNSVVKIEKLIEKISRTNLVPEEKKVLDELIVAWNSYNISRQNTYNLAIEGKLEEARQNAQTDAAVKFKSVAEKIQRLIQIQDEVTKSVYEEASKSYVSSRNTIIGLGTFAVVIASAFVLVLTKLIANPLADFTNIANRIANGELDVTIESRGRDEIGQLSGAMKKMLENLKEIIGGIKSSADNLASASQQLSASSEQMSKGIAQQVSKASQIATSSTEMSQSIVDIAKNASDMASFATEAVRVAREGEREVSKSIEEVNAIASVVNESSGLIVSLGSRSRQISEIVTVIKDIADQTNLLALNAAIEAARAGEQGRGFAVVADEVRKLAERTTKATQEIEGMIKTIQGDVDRAVSSMEGATKKVEKGVELSKKAGKALQDIVNSVTNLQSMVQQIASATEEMSAVSEQITQDIEMIAGVTNETSSNATQISQASADLARLAASLEGMVSQFRI
ncbi:Methyl-accepting chemotaxis protein McpQ [bacterium HR37]|nr:Methyl-accepting chemotaxis protein McpQ [bacterium HR37]